MVAVKLKKISYTASLATLAFVGGSLFSFSIGVVKVTPVQHLLNLVTGVALGPWYALSQAFVASLLRNIAGTGTLLAFPGSLIGAFLVGVVYRQSGKLMIAGVAEVFGTGLIGGIVSDMLARGLLGMDLPFGLILRSFLVSAIIGISIGYPVVKVLKKRFPRLFNQQNDQG